jgi:general secretion pathway protein G
MGTGARSHDTPVTRRAHRPWCLSRAIGAVTTAPLRGRLSNQRGFTLIELLVVIIVLGLLVGLVGPRLFGRVGQSKQAAAKAQIELLGAGLDQYRLDVGAYPNTSQGVDALQKNPGVQNWNGPYLKKAVPKDPWGNPYKYRNPGQHGDYDLWSEGADGSPGGEGENTDIVSWDVEKR